MRAEAVSIHNKDETSARSACKAGMGPVILATLRVPASAKWQASELLPEEPAQAGQYSNTSPARGGVVDGGVRWWVACS